MTTAPHQWNEGKQLSFLVMLHCVSMAERIECEQAEAPSALSSLYMGRRTEQNILQCRFL